MLIFMLSYIFCVVVSDLQWHRRLKYNGSTWCSAFEECEFHL